LSHPNGKEYASMYKVCAYIVAFNFAYGGNHDRFAMATYKLLIMFVVAHVNNNNPLTTITQ
jgi:hypothetical protein